MSNERLPPSAPGAEDRSLRRARLDWLHYKAEASQALELGDAERATQMDDLFEAYLAFQRSKSPSELLREARAEWALNRGRINPKYVALRAVTGHNEQGGDR